MAIVVLRVNGQEHTLDIDPSTPLLWALRDHLGFSGTKYGCGIAQCGACTVHVGGVARRSCSMTVGQLQGENIVTIEGLATNFDPNLQKLWSELNVAQCGYCQSGMLMAASDMLNRIENPTDEDIDRHMTNICRCGSYPRIRKAIHEFANSRKG